MNEIVGVRLAAGIVHQRPHLIVVCLVEAIKSIANIFTNGARKKHRLLLNDSYLVVIPTRLEILDVLAIEVHATGYRVVEALDEGDDARLAAARCPTQGDYAVFDVINLDAETFQYLHVTFARVVELDVTDLQLTINFTLNFLSSLSINICFILHQLDNFVASTES